MTLTLTFVPDTGQDDPAVQFQTGGRTVTLTIPAGSTSTPEVGIQSRDGRRHHHHHRTPERVQLRRDAHARAHAHTAAESRAARDFLGDGGAHGHRIQRDDHRASSVREITQGVFAFTGATGSNLQTTQITLPMDQLFAQWWASAASVPFGSQFVLSLPFTVQGSPQSVVSLTVTLANRLGKLKHRDCDSAVAAPPVQPRDRLESADHADFPQLFAQWPARLRCHSRVQGSPQSWCR